MTQVEEIIKYCGHSNQVHKYYSLLAKMFFENEIIERMYFEESFTPKALVVTNKRIVECRTKAYGTELEILFYAFLHCLKEVKFEKGILTDDFEFHLKYTSVKHKCSDYKQTYSEQAHVYIKSKIEEHNKSQDAPNTEKASDTTTTKKSDPQDESEARLIKLKTLFDKQLINEKEYNDKKADILSSF